MMIIISKCIHSGCPCHHHPPPPDPGSVAVSSGYIQWRNRNGDRTGPHATPWPVFGPPGSSKTSKLKTENNNRGYI